MRITIAGSGLLGANGGIDTYNCFLADKLLERGHMLQIVTQDDLFKLQEAYPSCNLFVTQLPNTVREEPQWANFLFKAIISFDPDVIINTSSATVGSLFPSFARRRVCISVSHFYDGVIAKIAAIYPEATDWIVAISNAGKDYLTDYIGPSYGGIVVLYNSIHDISSNEEVIRNKLNNGPIIVCYPGGANRIKCPDIFLKVVQHFDSEEGIYFEWLGDPKMFRSRLRSVRNIHFSGLVSVTESQRLIASSHLFVLPSRSEGCPMSLLEAMRSGSVPLVSDCPSAMRELVVNGRNGFVVRSNRASGYISAIETLLHDTNMLHELSKNARQTYYERLHPNYWIEAMERLFVTRPACSRGEHDNFRRECLLRFQKRPGRWFKPTIPYLISRLGILDRRPI
jgi:glycosyltransferase involved in cell wall biosynthesis